LAATIKQAVRGEASVKVTHEAILKGDTKLEKREILEKASNICQV